MMVLPYPHYFKDVSKLSAIDVYRVLLLFGVSDPWVEMREEDANG